MSLEVNSTTRDRQNYGVMLMVPPSHPTPLQLKMVTSAGRLVFWESMPF